MSKPPLVKILEQWNEIQYPKSEYVFAKNNRLYSSAHVNSWIKTIKKYLPSDMQNKKITSHVFRRTHSQLLLEAGVPLTYISKRLGHIEIDTTDNYYLFNSKELEKQSLEKFDNYLNQIN
ncbi:tyrosine-type recombinase/integrase [Ligilactobacillus sp. LYQ135]